MSKKYSKFLPSADQYDIEQFPYYWVTQVHEQYVQNVDQALKKYGLDNSRRRILLEIKKKGQHTFLIPPHRNTLSVSHQQAGCYFRS